MAKFLLASLFAALAISSPVEERGLSCNAVNSIVTILNQQRVATPFCSSLLHIPTVTKTCTAAFTPRCSTVTSNVQSTATVTAFATSYVYGTTTVYPVVAISETSTCALGATTIASSSAIVTPIAKVKRGNYAGTSTAIGTPTCLKNYVGDKITSACSCLNIPTPTKATVSTLTLPAKTITKVVAVTAKTTVTSTIVSTSFTSTYSATQYYTSTFTILPQPSSTIAPSSGAPFGVYPGIDFAGADIQNFFCYAGGPAAPSPYPACTDLAGCVDACAYYNANNLGGSASTTCGAVIYNAPPDGSSGSCYLKTGQTGCGSPNDMTTLGVILPLVANDVQ